LNVPTRRLAAAAVDAFLQFPWSDGDADRWSPEHEGLTRRRVLSYQIRL